MKLMFDFIRDNLMKSAKAMKTLSCGPDDLLSGLMGDKIQKFMLDNIEKPPKIAYKDVPNMAPPYEEMWFEWADNGTFSRIGVYVHVVKQNPEGWNYWLTIFTERQQAVGVLPYLMTFSIPLCGKTKTLRYQYHYAPSSVLATEETLNEFAPALSTCAGTVLFAIGLLHCKNIVQIEKGGKNPNIKNRRHRSKGTKHYVLDVVPARNIKRTEYDHPIKGSPQRIHFRRGHFKEFTSERPLFGKYTGAFWWESHVAGKAELGKVVKDYQIFPKSAM